MYKIYQIKEGDTLDAIASEFGTTTDEIRRLNGGLGEMTVGGYLIVPVGKPEVDQTDTYMVQKGDNMYQIARKFQVDYPFLLAYNGIEEKDYIYPGEIIRIPREKDRVYFTEEGDTISSVAENFGITPEKLFTKNPDLFLMKEQIIHY